jgi:hypothetical protein
VKPLWKGDHFEKLGNGERTISKRISKNTIVEYVVVDSMNLAHCGDRERKIA